jgi:hypothetical protein
MVGYHGVKSGIRKGQGLRIGYHEAVSSALRVNVVSRLSSHPLRPV